MICFASICCKAMRGLRILHSACRLGSGCFGLVHSPSFGRNHSFSLDLFSVWHGFFGPFGWPSSVMFRLAATLLFKPGLPCTAGPFRKSLCLASSQNLATIILPRRPPTIAPKLGSPQTVASFDARLRLHVGTVRTRSPESDPSKEFKACALCYEP